MLDALLVFAHLPQQFLHSSCDLLSLPIEQPENKKDQQNMLAGGLGGAGRKLKLGHAERLADLIRTVSFNYSNGIFGSGASLCL